ncbi:RagB/SusD family nutrient uptake outer membrane protein [Compostibacter hankyongensis]|uniref:RagB/SusD family nutrient uptake outer membrane protein n=1 Tax=Compostibacter hankyongensis TaxID=1007089 RepID=A0ABP8FLT2_9BACT
MKNFNIKLTVTGLLTLCMVWMSCNKELLRINPSQPTETAYFTRQSAFQQAVLGIYAKLTDLYSYNNINWLQEALLLPGDDLTATQQNNFEDFVLAPENGKINGYYNACYQMIARANVVLYEIDSVKEGVFSTEQLKNYNHGEALFLRAFAFYNLWNMFGTSPLDTTRFLHQDELYPPGSEGTQLLDQAIRDLTAAAGLLPESWDNNNRGRVTRNSAYGMLGKCLVFRATVKKDNADYQAAIAAFDQLSGLSLVSDFEDNFNYRTENNEESLFEFQASSPTQVDNVYLNNDVDYAVGQASAYWGFFDNNYAQYGQPIFIATQKLLDSFTDGDPRLPLTLDPASRQIKKYVLNNELTGFGVGSTNNPRILRYADVLLLKAEAILQSGGSAAAAVALINQVRTRARNMVPGGTQPENLSGAETNRNRIMQWIMDERLRELAGEGQRWFDLRRWTLGGLIAPDNDFFSSATPALMKFDPDTHLYFPIPTDETERNPNVQQNPGY